MKSSYIKKLRKEVDGIHTGGVAPARVYTLETDGNGGFIRKDIDPEEFRRQRAMSTGNEAKFAGQSFI